MALGKITASSLRLRSQPDSSTSGNIIKSLPIGTLVDIIKTVAGSNYTFKAEGVTSTLKPRLNIDYSV